MKNMKAILAVFVIISMLIISACKDSKTRNNGANKDTQVINIGLIYPLTGDAAFWGNNARNGATLAVENFMKSNKDLHINVIYEDSKSTTKDAVSAANKLIFQDKVKFIVGDLVSSNLLAMAPVCQQNKIVTIGQGSNPKLRGEGDYIFRTWPSDDLQGEAIASFLENNLKPENPALIFINNEYGSGVADIIEKKYAKKIPFKESYNVSQRDFKTLLLKIPAICDALVIVAYPEELPVLLKQLTNVNRKLKVVGTETFENKDVKAMKISFPVYYTLPAFADTLSAPYKTFVTSYEKKFGKKPEVPSDPAYDAMTLILEGIKKEGYVSDKVKDYILGIKDYEGASGRISFDANGDVIKDFIIKSLNNNRDSILTRIILK